MSKEFNCPSCSALMIFAGGESIFQTCKACNAPVIVPSEFLYKKDEQLASEDFASLVNDIPVDVEQVTNELTPGSELPKAEDVIDPDARIEKFEIYQEKIGTSSVETKKAVDKIVAPVKDEKFKTASPFANDDGSISMKVPKAISIEVPEELKAKTQNPEPEPAQPKPHRNRPKPHPVMARIKNELATGDKIEAIKIFRSRFNTSLRDAKDAVEAMERGENIDISDYQR